MVAGLCCTQLNPVAHARWLHTYRVDRSTEQPCHCSLHKITEITTSRTTGNAPIYMESQTA